MITQLRDAAASQLLGLFPHIQYDSSPCLVDAFTNMLFIALYASRTPRTRAHRPLRALEFLFRLLAFVAPSRTQRKRQRLRQFRPVLHPSLVHEREIIARHS